MYDSLVLSGGGLRALAHLGALVKLEELNQLDLTKIKYYAGTSMGSILAFLLCIGCKPLEIFHLFCTITDFLKIENLNQSLTNAKQDWGFMEIETIINHIKPLVIKKLGMFLNFRDLEKFTGKQLFICACDLTNSKAEYFSFETTPEMNVYDALCYSCNIPFLFKAKTVGDKYYVDGGMVDNFPLRAIPHSSTKILGLLCEGKSNKIKGILGYLNKLAFLSLNEIVNRSIQESNKCDVFRLPLEGTPIISLKLTYEEKITLFEKGYNCIDTDKNWGFEEW